MIEQFINRSYMVAVSEGAKTCLAREISRRASHRRGGALGPLDDFETTDLQALAEALGALPRELDTLGADSGENTGIADRTATVDDYVFLPHHGLMSLLQSAVEQAVEEHQESSIITTRSDTTRRGGPPPAVANRRLKGVELVESGSNRRAWRQMEVATGKWVWLSDPRWALSLLSQSWRDCGAGRPTFVNRPAQIRIANDAQLIIIGDWGSGLERARNVGEQVRNQLNLGEGKQQVVIHLGDVYYSGTKREFDRRFLDPWPVTGGSDVISLTVPGNHELYSGGFAFFDRALGDDRFSRQNGCSYFALASDYWQFLGLDTAYKDGGLHGDQADWARKQIDESPPEVKTCLLTHHQLFSAHSLRTSALRSDVGSVLATERIDAWLWGHEHRCIEYGPTTVDGHRVGFASCVGHGGIPEYLVMKEGDTCPKPWVYEYLVPFDDGIEPWGTFGFAVVELHDERMSIRYINERGEEHHVVPDVTASSR